MANIAAGSEQGSASPESGALTAPGGGAGGGGSVSGVEGTRSNGTRLSRTTRQDLNYVVVIVDTTRLRGAPMAAVADYIAMVSLAQINPDMNTTDFATILNLFNPGAATTRATEMTAWDTAFLDGLYHMTRNARTLAAQRNEIALRISEAR